MTSWGLICVIYEPSQVPTFTNLPDSKFNGWIGENNNNNNNRLSFPFSVNPSKKDSEKLGNLVIDGNKVDYYYCIFPDITPYAKAKIMDGDQVLAEDVLIDLNNIDLTKYNHVLEGIYTDAECTKALNVSDILLNGADNLCLYTKWIELKTLWSGDNYGSLNINDWADDIGSDSVFYIEVYHNYPYAIETKYNMHDGNWISNTTYSDLVTVPAGGTTLLKIAPSASDIAYMKQNGIYVSSDYNRMYTRSVKYTPTACVNVSVMDGDTVYTSFVLNNLSGVNNINIPTKDNAVLEGLYKDASCTIPFTQDSISDILASGVESTCLYTKWNETNSGDEKPAE